MDLYNDFAEPLRTEVLSDMAENFFGTRKHLEDTTELFMEFVEKLRKIDVYVAEKAGLLNYLLLNEKNIREFYALINVKSSDVFLVYTFSKQMLPELVPFAFTAKGEFIQFVCWAYNELQKACDEYNNGKQYNHTDKEDAQKINVNYRLIRNMCELVNKEVDKVNNDMSPLMVLQCFKKFDPETIDKESSTGAPLHGACNGLDRTLCYRHIGFDSLQLKEYPEIPKCVDMKDKITSFCKRIYAENKQEIKERLHGLKEKIKKE